MVVAVWRVQQELPLPWAQIEVNIDLDEVATSTAYM
jgi:hypothetical protein